MRLLIIFTSLFSLVFVNAKAQNRLSSFELHGTVNIDTGKVKLIFSADSSYYPKGLSALSGTVHKGHFLIKGKIPYAHPFYLEMENYMSEAFLIQPGKQKIAVDLNLKETVPRVNNIVMKEYYTSYLTAYKVHRLKHDSISKEFNLLWGKTKDSIAQIKMKILEKEIRESYNESDRILLAYVKTHPNSYIGFWKLVHLLDFGYKEIFDSILPNFSDSIKNTYAGELFKKKLKIAGALGIGKQFPVLNCAAVNNKKLVIKDITNNNYTLIDFWYSNCSPCINAFPGLKRVYDKYKNKGFQIIGISTDKRTKEADWQRIINQHKLIWPQYWDKDGVEVARLGVRAFPTSLLLNAKGEIIKQDLKEEELSEFLDKNLIQQLDKEN